jgi:hypothetical protein
LSSALREANTQSANAQSDYVVPERKTVAVDFDGVIHSYTSGWQGADVIPDPPIEGAIEFLNEVIEEFTLVIFTTRAGDEEARRAIMAWLMEHGFKGEYVEITNVKGPAIFYLDDRAWRFRGRFPTLSQIKRAYPWRVGEPLPGERARSKQQKGRRTIGELERKLGERKARERQMKAAIQEALDWFPNEETIPPAVEALRGFLT